MGRLKTIIENERHTPFLFLKLAKNLQMCEKMTILHIGTLCKMTL